MEITEALEFLSGVNDQADIIDGQLFVSQSPELEAALAAIEQALTNEKPVDNS